MHVSAYIEVTATQANDATATGGTMAYSIKCDPAGMSLESVGAGGLTVKQFDADKSEIAPGAAIGFPGASVNSPHSTGNTKFHQFL